MPARKATSTPRALAMRRASRMAEGLSTARTRRGCARSLLRACALAAVGRFFTAEMNPGRRRSVLRPDDATDRRPRMNLERWLYVATAFSMALAVGLTALSFYGS